MDDTLLYSTVGLLYIDMNKHCTFYINTMKLILSLNFIDIIMIGLLYCLSAV